jgi:hypothetical protein
MMNRPTFAGWCAILVLSLSNIAAAQPADQAHPGSWSGVVINASCNADEAFAEAAKCTAETPGAALALYDDTIRQVFTLDPQDRTKGHLGDSVTVEGTLEGGAIHVATLRMFSEVGLRAGQKGPGLFLRRSVRKNANARNASRHEWNGAPVLPVR